MTLAEDRDAQHQGARSIAGTCGTSAQAELLVELGSRLDFALTALRAEFDSNCVPG